MTGPSTLTYERIGDPSELAGATHEWLADVARETGGRWVALAVGASTLPLYTGLPWAPRWERRSLTPVDELVPSPADPERRFARRLRAALPEPFRARVVQLPAPPAPGAASEAAREVERRLGSEGLAGCVLGLGPDGHVAFNQPGSPRDCRTRVVELADENLARLGDVQPARAALTLGVGTILRAEALLVVAAGSGKRGALDRLLSGPSGPDVPVSWLREHPDLTVLATS